MGGRIRSSRWVSILLSLMLSIVACGGKGGAVSSQGVLVGGSIQGALLSPQGVVTTFAGNGTAGSIDCTVGPGAEFSGPTGVATDGRNLYIADGDNHLIRKIVIATGEVTTIAGSAGVDGFSDGTGPSARFRFPGGITTDGTNLYVADTNNHAIRKVDIATGNVTTIAGDNGVAGFADGVGSAALFNFPNGITTDGTNLYVADGDNHLIRKIVVSTGEVVAIAGEIPTGTPAPGYADGAGHNARFAWPTGIATDGSNLFITDTDNHLIRKMVLATGSVTTIAGDNTNIQWSGGSGPAEGYADGVGPAARFFSPAGITTDGTNLFVSDTGNHLIRKVVIATGAVTTVAGDNVSLSQGFSDGTGSDARFSYPFGITTDGNSLFVCDRLNQRIRRIR